MPQKRNAIPATTIRPTLASLDIFIEKFGVQIYLLPALRLASCKVILSPLRYTTTNAPGKPLSCILCCKDTASLKVAIFPVQYLYIPGTRSSHTSTPLKRLLPVARADGEVSTCTA